MSIAAWRAGSLTGTGAVAAFAIGAAALSRAWGWGAFLITWFLLASVLSRTGKARKLRQTDGVVEKGSRRDAMQVVANGGVFGLLSLASTILTGLLGELGSTGIIELRDLMELLSVSAAAALVAAGADTWATEIGTLRGARPWSLRTRARVPVGTSGAVSLPGTFASVAGAVVLASAASMLGVIPTAALLLVASCGFVGASVDTVVGAWWQDRRWCPACRMETEQAVHRCGVSTVHRAGSTLLTNDVVNLVCTISGALLAALLWTLR